MIYSILTYQTAKELSQYMYIFHRGDTIENPTKPVDELIKETGDFTNMIKREIQTTHTIFYTHIF